MYNKLFTQILDSSVWLESDTTRIVWLTFIAAMDQDGFARFATVENLARRANVATESAQLAVDRLMAPDPGSSDPDHEGRRLERVPGGWIVLNAPKYKDLVTRVIQREQTRERVARFREKTPKITRTKRSNASVTASNKKKQNVTPSEAYTDAHLHLQAEAVKSAPRMPTSPQNKGAAPMALGLRRLKVWRWMLEDMMATLGDHADAFDIPAWLSKLDRTASVLPGKDDYWPWLQAELLAEVGRRGLPVATASTPTAPTNKRIAGLIKGGDAFLEGLRKDGLL